MGTKTKENKNQLWQDIRMLITNRNYLLMMLISTVSSFSLSMAKTPLTKYGMSIGLNPAQVGATWGTYYLICLIVRPFTGPLIDRFDKKKILILCFLVKAAAYLGYAISDNTTIFYASRYIDAVSFCLVTSSFSSVTSLLINKKMMGTGIAIYSAVPGIFLTGAPMLSTWLFDSVSGPSVYWSAVGISVMGILFVCLLQFPQMRQEMGRSGKKISFNDFIYLPCVPVCMLTFFLAVLMTVNDTYLLVMAESRGIQGAALFFTVQSALKVIASLSVGISSDFIGIKKIMIPSCIGTALASVLLGSTGSLIVIVLCAVIYTMAQKGTAPVLIKAATMCAPVEKRGVAIATNYFIQDVAGVFGGYVCAFLFSNFGYTGTYYAVAAFPAIGLFWFLATYKKSFAGAEQKQKGE